MKKIIFLIQVIFIGCFSTPTEQELLNKSNPNGFYGQKITLSKKLKINTLILDEEKYLNKDVFITGKIIEVCPMRGCWIKINDKSSDYNLRIKVTDGDIVFPLSSKGRKVVAEGQFSVMTLNKNQAKNWKKHLAAEKGVDIDTASIVLTDSDYFEYRLNTNGAEIF